MTAYDFEKRHFITNHPIIICIRLEKERKKAERAAKDAARLAMKAEREKLRTFVKVVSC